MGADLTTIAAVDDIAVVEMKWEEGSCWSGHPHPWSAGGACNSRLQIWQILRKRERSRSKKKGSKRNWSENKERKAKTDLLVVFLGVLQVTTVLTADRKEKKRGSHYGSPPFSGFLGGTWTHAPPVAGARGEDAPPLSLQFQKASSIILGFLRVCFVIFTCWNMYLN